MRTSLRSLNTSATSVSTTTFDAHIDLLGGQSESNDDQCTESDRAEDNLEDFPWVDDIRDFLQSDRPPRRIVHISPDDPDKVVDFLQLVRYKCLYH